MVTIPPIKILYMYGDDWGMVDCLTHIRPRNTTWFHSYGPETYDVLQVLRVISAIRPYLVGGFKHGFYFPQYMGCHPSHWRIHIFQDCYCTTNQLSPTSRNGKLMTCSESDQPKATDWGRHVESWSFFRNFLEGISIYIYMRKTITSSMFGNRFSISHPNPRRQHLHGCGPRSNPVHFQRQYQGQRVERRPTGLGKVTRQFFRAWWCAVSWRISWWV